jgi:predicted lactoylglutathione lyase
MRTTTSISMLAKSYTSLFLRTRPSLRCVNSNQAILDINTTVLYTTTKYFQTFVIRISLPPPRRHSLVSRSTTTTSTFDELIEKRKKLVHCIRVTETTYPQCRHSMTLSSSNFDFGTRQMQVVPKLVSLG